MGRTVREVGKVEGGGEGGREGEGGRDREEENEGASEGGREKGKVRLNEGEQERKMGLKELPTTLALV